MEIIVIKEIGLPIKLKMLSDSKNSLMIIME